MSERVERGRESESVSKCVSERDRGERKWGRVALCVKERKCAKVRGRERARERERSSMDCV